MHRYLLVVDAIYHCEEVSHAVFFKASNGEVAETYAEEWIENKYADDKESIIEDWDLILIREIGNA